MASMRVVRPRSKGKILSRGRALSRQEFDQMGLSGRVATIRDLVQLGLMHIQEELDREVVALAGERYARKEPATTYRRHGRNPGSVRLAGQKVGIWAPRVRGPRGEVPLTSYQAFQAQDGALDERLYRRVLLGISCRDYEAAAEAIPGALGLSSSTVSRQFVAASSRRLRELQERDLSALDLVALFVDGKTFAEDELVLALGVTLDGRKVVLGFVQTATENAVVLKGFFGDLQRRGLAVREGLLVVIDGAKGLRSAAQAAFKGFAVIQRCQWHKRENVVSYLPKREQAAWRRRLQWAYSRPTYGEAKRELEKLLAELEVTNQSAAASLREGLEETLTLHRLGVFARLGLSFKTTNCVESINSQAQRRCGKVTAWKNSSQKQRWFTAALLDIELRLRRVRGHRHLGQLRAALQEHLGLVTSGAERAA